MVARSSVSTYTILPAYDPNEIIEKPVFFRVIPTVYVVKSEKKTEQETKKED